MKITAKRSTGNISIGLMVTSLFLIVAMAILGMVAAHEHSRAVFEQKLSEQRPTGLPPLQKEMRARESLLLDTAVVIDSAAGVYRIPIDRAMELIAREANR